MVSVFFSKFLHKIVKKICVHFYLCQFSDSALMNGKNTNRNEIDKKKMAFSDIRNAQQLNSGEKLSTKNVQMEASDDEYGKEFASSKPVDYQKVWVEKFTLTDNEIDRWIKMLNVARNMNPYDETEPLPIPEEDIHFEESKCFELWK